MSHFTDERGRHLNERIILLFNDSVSERLRQLVASGSSDFPSEALLELLARQVWAFYEENQIYLVTRSITLIGKTVQIHRGDYALQIDSVVTTNHTMVTQAFRGGVRVETDWEIVTPLRGFPYPTTRGALQLLESITADENEQPPIPPADAIWSQDTGTIEENVAQTTLHEDPLPVTENIPIEDTSKAQEIIAQQNEEEENDPQRMIDELLGRLAQSPSPAMSEDTIPTGSSEASHGFTPQNNIEKAVHPREISHSDELENPASSGAFSKPLSSLDPSYEPSNENLPNDSLLSTDNKIVANAPEDSSDDPQKLVDLWLKKLVAEKNQEEEVTELSSAPPPSPSFDNPSEDREEALGERNNEGHVDPLDDGINASPVTEDSSSSYMEEPLLIQKGEETPETELEEVTLSFDDTPVKPEPSYTIEEPLNEAVEPQVEINPLPTGSGMSSLEMMSQPSEDMANDSQSLVDQWIRSIAPEATPQKDNFDDKIPEGIHGVGEEKISASGVESIPYDEEINQTSEDVSVVSKDQSTSNDDPMDFFEHLFSNVTPEPRINETVPDKLQEMDLNTGSSVIPMAENKSALVVDTNQMAALMKACGQPWVDALKRWGEDLKGNTAWSRLVEILPLRIVWMASNSDQASAIWNSIKDCQCRHVRFEDDQILEQWDGAFDHHIKELWLSKYRQARINLESDMVKLRLLRSQLDMIGKYFQDYDSYKKELQQLSDVVETPVAIPKSHMSQMHHFKKELFKLIAKQAEMEERLRSWIYSTRELRHVLSPRYIQLQEEYKELLTQAAAKGRELNQLINASPSMPNAAPPSHTNKDRIRLEKELADIDRYIGETYGKNWKSDPIWPLFEKKDLNGISGVLSEREAGLTIQEKALSHWQNIIEEIPAVLMPQIWVGCCKDLSNFMFHQFYPHIIIVEGQQTMESLLSTPWMVIHHDGRNNYRIEPGETEAPYDPQLLWGVCGCDDQCKKLSSIIWDQRELMKNGGEFLA